MKKISTFPSKPLRVGYKDQFFWVASDGILSSIFSECFQCINQECNESVMVIGIKCVEERGYEYFDEEGLELDIPMPILTVKTTIKHIEPPIDLFKIPSGTPIVLIYELKKAFNLFWADSDACANKIRMFTELLLNELKIPAARNLHSRIEDYMQKSRNTKLIGLGNKLMAIKWIGNQGSHSNVGLTSQNMIDAFEILENILNKIYDKSDKVINRKVKHINKNKKIL